MTDLLRVALAQYPSGCDCAGIVAQAKAAAAEIVVFPEMYLNGYARFDPDDPAARVRWCAAAKSADGEFDEKFRRAAKLHRIHAVATFLERAEPKPFNAALLIDPTGRTILHHRKVHICDFDSPELACGRGMGFAMREIETGAGPVKFGLMICMDREHPKAARALSRQGAGIVLVANCCDLATDRSVGDVRIAQAQGRAFERPRMDPERARAAVADDGNSSCRKDMIYPTAEFYSAPVATDHSNGVVERAALSKAAGICRGVSSHGGSAGPRSGRKRSSRFSAHADSILLAGKAP